ncbi:MAG: outer membrane beta-barrel protein [Coxiellaceae bacterium]|jgi:opacity protein-like surface antigen|nr:outer membrane beta-barrel protein [Coxiellaceae bacterium]
MLKLFIKGFFITVLIVTPVFASDTLSTFHRQADISYPEPIAEEAYFATKAPMESKIMKHVGINLGIGIVPLKSEVTINNVSQTQDKRPMIYNAGIDYGYGGNLQHLYIDAESGAVFNLLDRSITDTVNGHSTELSVKMPVTGYLDLRPGFLSYNRNFLFYGRVGVGGSWFKLKFTDNTVTNSTDEVNFGLRLGVGLENIINDTFSWRIEYVHTKYKKINNNAYSLKSSANQVGLGLMVYF